MSHPLQQAVLFHRQGKLADARPLYEDFLRGQPDHTAALNLLGVLLLQQGDATEALVPLNRASQLDPTNSGILNNLGNALRATGSPEDAHDAWKRAISADDGNADAWCNLGVFHLEQGDEATASTFWQQAIDRNPNHTDSLNMLAVYHHSTGQKKDALNLWRRAQLHAPHHPTIQANLISALLEQSQHHIQQDQLRRAEHLAEEATGVQPQHLGCWMLLGDIRRRRGQRREAFVAYQRALSIDETRPEIHHNIGNLLKESGQNEQAIAAFRRALALGSTHPATQHALAALTGAQRTAAPAAVVRDLFDQYADRFEDHLTDTLEYQTPRHLRALHGDAPIHHLLDLGCGTGLAGAAFSDVAQTITGVDLSPNMLALAEKRGVYGALWEMDVLTFLHRPGPAYDRIIAADVFVYIGDLTAVLAAIAARLTPGGHLLFSTEQHTGVEAAVLQSSERFAHSDEHVRQAAAAAGLDILQQRSAPIRREADQWLTGTLHQLQRPMA